MSAAVSNPFEAAAREAKVDALVSTIDAALVDMRPPVAPVEIARLLATWGESQWLRVANRADVHLPSPTTREQVIDRYRQRAQRAKSDALLAGLTKLLRSGSQVEFSELDGLVSVRVDGEVHGRGNDADEALEAALVDLAVAS